MQIKSTFLTGIISRIVTKTARKKLGANVNVQVNAVSAKFEDGKVRIHLDVDAFTSDTDLIKILNTAGLD